MRIISCVNNDGEMIKFNDEWGSWILTDVDGIYLIDSNVYTSDNTMTDGATYQGATVKKRNIVMTLLDKGEDHRTNRKHLYTVFKPKAKGTFFYTEEGDTKRIEYNVEKVDVDSLGKHRSAVVSLICPDPFFEDLKDTDVLIAGWAGEFIFKHIFDGGFTFGEKSTEKLKTITNESAADNVGLTLLITSTDRVTNPSITRVESQQTMQIGTESVPFVLLPGDTLKITTGINDKHVYLIRDDHAEEINKYLNEKSEFVQLMRGINTIGYNADAGAEHMSVHAEFRYKYLGV